MKNISLRFNNQSLKVIFVKKICIFAFATMPKTDE